MYQVSAAGIAGSPGTVEVLVNTGSNLIQQALQPGLSVKVTRKVKKVGKKKIVTRFAQALDDGFGVPGGDLQDRRPDDPRERGGDGEGPGRLRKGCSARLRRRLVPRPLIRTMVSWR